MKVILLSFAIPAIFCLAGCGTVGNVEEVGEPQSGQTVYRAPGGSGIGETIPTPPPQRVPGESR